MKDSTQLIADQFKAERVAKHVRAIRGNVDAWYCDEISYPEFQRRAAKLHAEIPDYLAGEVYAILDSRPELSEV